jgi:hypothetical protein
VEGQHAPKIEVDKGIAIEEEKLFLKVGKRINQGAGGSAGRCFFDTADADAEFASVAKRVVHHISAVMNEK